MSDVSAFFGKGYTERKHEPKPEENLFEDIDYGFEEPEPSDEYNVAINVMGTLYQGMEKIEIFQGDIIVDGLIAGKMPITSGTWFKTLKGEHWKNPHDKKNILSIVSKCDTI